LLYFELSAVYQLICRIAILNPGYEPIAVAFVYFV
jgi:hypothetical protein